MIFDMGKNAMPYPWEPIKITADDLETREAQLKTRLAVHRARLAIGAASIERMIMASPGYTSRVFGVTE